MKKIVLKAGQGKRVKNGHKWVFSNEIKFVTDLPAITPIIDDKPSNALLYDNDENLIGKGFYNKQSLITFRLISTKDEVFDEKFWQSRIASADALRKNSYPDLKSYRAVFGESDNMSGIIIDKYDDYLVGQFLAAGADACKQDILNAAKAFYKSKGIFIRNDSGLRKFENLPEENEIYFGEIPDEVVIKENGLKFCVDIKNGQKTGFFFDQRDNRKKFAGLVKGKKVLDCYCHSGGFGIYAKNAQAKEVVFVDSSMPALELAEKNFNLNGFENFNGIKADALEYMLSKDAKDQKFDIVNIDPPGLIKSKKDFNAGLKHYVKVNEAAMGLFKTSGILTFSSCSHHLNFDAFNEVIATAAAHAKKTAQILQYSFQSQDHPTLPSMPETHYLIFAVVLVS
jgi:23S rRNA (cytosine1962-C5)-methyltransferase